MPGSAALVDNLLRSAVTLFCDWGRARPQARAASQMRYLLRIWNVLSTSACYFECETDRQAANGMPPTMKRKRK
ncbi:hypothetical protein CIW54_23405 [Paraburkholderia sp. T12-10]|nr:hypothetical protein CIW54_23405 [Paraburkholderia sp. T12-10]